MTGEQMAAMYYRDMIGAYLWDIPNSQIITGMTLQYLFDSGFTDEEVLQICTGLAKKNVWIITPDELPQSIWDDETNLVSRNQYYFHKELHIIPPPATARQIDDGRVVITPCINFWIEMKARYTIQDIMKYFRKRMIRYCPIAEQEEIKKEMGAFSYLLRIYNRKDPYVSNIDLILSAIDYHADHNGGRITNILNLQNDADEIYEDLKWNNKAGIQSGVCRIIPRSSFVSLPNNPPSVPERWKYMPQEYMKT